MIMQHSAGAQSPDPLQKISIRYLNHAHHHPVSHPLWGHFRAITQNGLHDPLYPILFDIQTEVVVSIGVQLNGQDLPGPGMDGHGKREIADTCEHVHHVLSPAEIAHAHALIQIAC